MKKRILFLFALLLLLVACNKGSVNGYVTYQLSEFGSPAVDQYAEIYLTQRNVDTISAFLTVVRLQEQIERHKKDIKRTDNRLIIDSLQKEIGEKEHLIAQKVSNQSEFLALSDKAMRSFIQIKEDNKTYKALVDNEGLYSNTIKVGDYNLMAVSEMVKKDNLLERRGKLFITSISISKEKQVKVNINFK